MGNSDNQIFKGEDAGFKRILLCFEGYDPITLSGRPRNYHAPVEVCFDLDSVRLTVETNDPASEVALDGNHLAAGHTSEPLSLSIGRNAFWGSVTSADGKAKTDFSVKVFRNHPRPAWEQVISEAPWVPRDSAGELVFRDRMWLLGGYIPSLTNDVWSSADGVSWTRARDVPTRKGIDVPIAFVFQEKMWVTDLDGVLFSSVNGKSWSVETTEAPWRGRSGAGCIVFNGKIWVMGGKKDGELLNDIWSSADGVSWTLELDQAPWSKRQIHHTPVVLGDHMFLLGGGALGPDYHPFVAWNDVWRSSDGTHWEQVLHHAPWLPRIWGSSAVYRDRMWILGGFRAEPTWENLGDVWYSSDGADWRMLETSPSIRHSGHNNVSYELSDSVWAPRHEESVYTFDDAMWVVGGMVWPLKNDVWRIEIPGLCFVTQPVLEAYEGGLYEYQAQADFNHNLGPVQYKSINGPCWLTVDEDTGLLCGTAPHAGDFEVCLEAYDVGGETTHQEYTIHVISCK